MRLQPITKRGALTDRTRQADLLDGQQRDGFQILVLSHTWITLFDVWAEGVARVLDVFGEFIFAGLSFTELSGWETACAPKRI